MEDQSHFTFNINIHQKQLSQHKGQSPLLAKKLYTGQLNIA